MSQDAVIICKKLLDEFYESNNPIEMKRKHNYLYAFIYAKLNTLSIDQKVYFVNFLHQDINTKRIYDDLINSSQKNLANTNNEITISMSKQDYELLMKLFSKLKGVS